jgi:hypothetical protein
MNKSGFIVPQILIFTLALAVVAGGYLVFKPEAKTGHWNDPYPPVEDEVYTNGCIKVVGGIVGIQNDCKEISDCNFYPENSEQKDSCYFGVATNKKDEEVCNFITNPSQKNGCLENIQQSKRFMLGKITMLSPNGGEVIRVGDVYKIQWNSTGLDSNLNVVLDLVQSTDTVAGGWGVNPISRIGTENLAKGYYNWTVPNMAAKGYNSYKIKIQLANGDDVGDVSDGVFEIKCLICDPEGY